jgi:hypothetical protein
MIIIVENRFFKLYVHIKLLYLLLINIKVLNNIYVICNIELEMMLGFEVKVTKVCFIYYR